MNTNKPARWFRMYAEFASDPKLQMLSECYQRRYMMILCLRCSNGNVTLQDTEVAFQLRIDVTEWEKTKAVFVEKNLINKHNQPTAWDKRQFASDSSAERVAAHRARQKEACNVTVTPPEKEKETKKETKKEKETEEKQKHIAVVFDYWKSVMGSSRAVLDVKRKRAIGSMLDNGYTAEDLCRAIDGCSKSSFHMGLNDKGMKYNGIDLIMRSAEYVDRFIGYCLNPPKPTGKQAQVEAINRIAVDEFVNSDLGGEYARIG